jgi:hypothetical protein
MKSNPLPYYILFEEDTAYMTRTRSLIYFSGGVSVTVHVLL